MRPDGFGIFRTIRYDFYQTSIGLIYADLRLLPAVVPGAGVCLFLCTVCVPQVLVCATSAHGHAVSLLIGLDAKSDRIRAGAIVTRPQRQMRYAALAYGLVVVACPLQLADTTKGNRRFRRAHVLPCIIALADADMAYDQR